MTTLLWILLGLILIVLCVLIYGLYSQQIRIANSLVLAHNENVNRIDEIEKRLPPRVVQAVAENPYRKDYANEDFADLVKQKATVGFKKSNRDALCSNFYKYATDAEIEEWMRKVTAWAKPLPLVHDPYALPSDLVKVTFSPTEELTEEQLLADDDEYLPTVFRNEEEKEK